MAQYSETAQKTKQSAPTSGGLMNLFKNNIYGYFFVMPWLIGFLVFCIYPFGYSFYLSLTNYAMKSTTDFVGLQNYITLIGSDVLFQKSVSVTMHYVLLGVPLQLAFALVLAMALNTGIPGLKYFRAAYYLPALMGGSVAIAVLWRQLFGLDGIVNQFLIFLGVVNPADAISWITSPDSSIYTLILLRVWQFGSPMIIFLAGLKQVPAELYESAGLDGANGFQKFANITLPMISPIIMFNLIMQIISAFQTFTSAFIIGGTGAANSGGVANSLLFYTLYLYRLSFQYFKMGMGSAIAWILLLILGAFTLVIFRSSSYWVHYND